MSDNIVVLVTTGSKDEAEAIAHELVHQRLAACVNIIATVQSIFHWQGKICTETECQLLIKTSQACFDKLDKAVREIHSYDVPEIIALPIITGATDYLGWLAQEVNSGSRE